MTKRSTTISESEKDKTTNNPSSCRTDPSIVIIGAGMTGILLGIKLREAGVTNITILEEKHEVGGTWAANTYPGVACDVPSNVYTYESEPNYDWSNLYARGQDIQQYFQRVFDKYNLGDLTQFGEKVISSVYLNGKWRISTANGNELQADILFSASGFLRVAKMPDIAGLDEFKGTLFHTSEWDHSVDLRGKRVGYIGTGSTAAQAVPELIKLTDCRVTVFQRTAAWIAKSPDTIYSERQKTLKRQRPRLEKIKRQLIMRVLSTSSDALTGNSFSKRLRLRILRQMSVRNLKRSIRDPELRKKLTPNYAYGCKRIVVNDTFYEAIQKDNARLETSPIDRITETGIRTQNGSHTEFDVIILSTGFHGNAFMRPMQLIGRDGITIEEKWKDGIQAYKSVCIPDFPNYFLMLGPNTPVGNFSIIAMSEVQTNYILQLIEHWRSGRLQEIEATDEAMRNWTTQLSKKMSGTTWASGCHSWYLDSNGSPLAWPDTWSNWLRTMKTVDLKHFK